YGTPDGAFASTGNDTTMYFLPFMLRDETVGLAAAAASFRKPGGESEMSTFCAQVPFALMTVVCCDSGTAASPPPPGSCPVAGSVGRERRAVCCDVPAFKSM